MARNTKKDKFYSVLKNIFIGARIEGNSGYVNLMRIKNKYYQDFKVQLESDISKKLDEVGRNFEEELYNKLYTFFKKYFSESGSIYFSYTPLQEKVYERIYRDDKDVMLFWKTNMLYYVKTERLYQNMDFQVDGDLSWYHFDVSELEHKQNNEKKELIFSLIKAEYNKENHEYHIYMSVKYSQNGTKSKITDIVKKIKKVNANKQAPYFVTINEEKIKKAIAVFRKQSEVDYFINKNAKEFLREQFSLWIKTYVFDDDTIFEELRLKQLKALRDIAYNIIDLVSQFEDELVKIWNKPKFAHSSNYVITIDKIFSAASLRGEAEAISFIKKILKHKGITEQITEWQELGMIDDKFNVDDIFKPTEQKEIFDKESKLNKKWQYLPLDTRYFKDFEFDILALFDNLDDQLDGWLIHSENYQALNTLKRKFYKKIDTVYIDPPYNAPASEIIYVNDYKHSSWITLMENRISLTKSFLKSDSVFECAIDENEQENLGKLLSKEFSEHDKVCVSIVHNPAGVQGDNFSYSHEYCYFVFRKNNKIIGKTKRDEDSEESFRDWGGTSSRSLAKNCFYPIIVKDNKIIGYGDVCPDDFHPNSSNVKKGDTTYIYPIKDGEERKWVFSRNTVEEITHELNVRERKDEIVITRTKKHTSYKTVWNNKKYYANIYGSKYLNNIIGEKTFDFPKSLHAVRDCLFAVNSFRNSGSICLDYFAGSGTTAHAIIEQNRNDGIKRKFLLVELGEHFYSTIIPRIKKVSFTDKWKEGKALEGGTGYSNFFKYYELEQYEETLRKAKYEDKGALPKDIYHQYIFFKDLKLADEVVKLDDETKSIKVDLTKLHTKIDIPETLSFLTGKFIKKIYKDKVVFTDESEIEYSNIDYRIVKPLIWW